MFENVNAWTRLNESRLSWALTSNASSSTPIFLNLTATYQDLQVQRFKISCERRSLQHYLSWCCEVEGLKVGTRWESPGSQVRHCLHLLLQTRHFNPLPRPFSSNYLQCSGEVLPNGQLLLGKRCKIHRAKVWVWWVAKQHTGSSKVDDLQTVLRKNYLSYTTKSLVILSLRQPYRF